MKTIAYLAGVLRYCAGRVPALCSGLLALAGATVAAPDAFAALPPLIDRDLLFGDPEIEGGQISPDGRLISLLKPFKDMPEKSQS